MARALLAGPHERHDSGQREALAAFGLALAGPPEQPQEIEVWPETDTPARLFAGLLTQWRMGPAGPVGLDYAALPVVERRLRIGRRAAREAFAGLQVMEAEALRWFAEQRA